MTLSERFWIWRRRVGLTQAAAGAALGCSRRTIIAIEADPGRAAQWVEEWTLPVVQSPAEEVQLIRRRAGLTLGAMAYRLNISRSQLYLLESGKVSVSLTDIGDIQAAVL